MKTLGETCKIVKKSNSRSSLYAFNMFLNYNFIKYLTKYKNKHTK